MVGLLYIFIRNSVSYQHLCCNSIAENFNEFEITMLELCDYRMFVLCLYIPPSLNSVSLMSLKEWLLFEVDCLLVKKPTHHLVIVGDFNHFDVPQLCNDLDLSDLVTCPTRHNNVLDHILISRDLNKIYDKSHVHYDSPISTADHVMISVGPVHQNIHTYTKTFVPVYDFRPSHLSRLRQRIESMSWNDICEEGGSVSDRCLLLHQRLVDTVDEIIPKKMVTLSKKDKEWITPVTKSLIHERWVAYENDELIE